VGAREAAGAGAPGLPRLPAGGLAGPRCRPRRRRPAGSARRLPSRPAGAVGGRAVARALGGNWPAARLREAALGAGGALGKAGAEGRGGGMGRWG